MAKALHTVKTDMEIFQHTNLHTFSFKQNSIRQGKFSTIKQATVLLPRRVK